MPDFGWISTTCVPSKLQPAVDQALAGLRRPTRRSPRRSRPRSSRRRTGRRRRGSGAARCRRAGSIGLRLRPAVARGRARSPPRRRAGIRSRSGRGRGRSCRRGRGSACVVEPVARRPGSRASASGSVIPPRSTSATSTPGSTWSLSATRSPSAITTSERGARRRRTRTTSAIRWLFQARANAARPGGSSGRQRHGRRGTRVRGSGGVSIAQGREQITWSRARSVGPRSGPNLTVRVGSQVRSPPDPPVEVPDGRREPEHRSAEDLRDITAPVAGRAPARPAGWRRSTAATPTRSPPLRGGARLRRMVHPVRRGRARDADLAGRVRRRPLALARRGQARERGARTTTRCRGRTTSSGSAWAARR